MDTKTPITDSCTKSADRYGDYDVIPARIARDLEEKLSDARESLKTSYSSEDVRTMIAAAVLEKQDKIDALRTELAATRLACEDWIKIANAGASDTARMDWLSKRARVDYSTSYWMASSGWPFREALDNSMRLLANNRDDRRRSTDYAQPNGA